MPRKRFEKGERRPAGNWLLGVCAEAADAWNISVSWVRSVFLLCTILSFGLFVIVYVLMHLSASTIQKEPAIESGRVADTRSGGPINNKFIEDLQQRLYKHQNRASNDAGRHPLSRHG